MCSWSHTDCSVEMTLELKFEGQIGVSGKNSVKVRKKILWKVNTKDLQFSRKVRGLDQG